MKLIFLSPGSVMVLQNLIFSFLKIKFLPFLHTEKYRHTIYVDVDNLQKHGHGALVSSGGQDRSKVLIIADSIEAYLEGHYQKLKEEYFYKGRGEIESFAANPLSQGANGSVCVT
jgi:hypothetical protein